VPRHEISRVEAFSDAVFAFALTLLVVALEVPDNYEQLMVLVSGFLPFACCFALLVWIWHEHNAFFRRFGLQDGYTIVLNGALLFVVLFYVYPLKFMFDSLFARFIPALASTVAPMTFGELASTARIYSLGFVALFALFALLYRHAYARRDALGLTPLDVFDARAAMGHHLVSAGIGLVALAIATVAPRELAPLSPTSFFLMGPAHYAFGTWNSRRRRALEARGMHAA